MPVALATPPTGLLYRVAHAPDPLAWPDRPFIGGSRFDDPLDQFRVLYLAEQRLGCFIEGLARFRPDVKLLTLLASVTGPTGSLPTPAVPAGWYRLGPADVVAPDDPDMSAAAQFFGLTIEP